MSDKYAEFSQGVCHDGAAILKNGQMMTIEEILEHIDYHQRLRETLRSAVDMAEYISLHEGFSGSPREYVEARALLNELDKQEKTNETK